MFEKARLFEIDKRRIIFYTFFVSMFIVTEIGRKIYRPYIYAHDIFDFWIADTIGNFTGTITVIFFELTIINPEHRKGRIFLLLIPIGLIIYELAQYFSPKSVVDWRDIVATLIAGLISFGTYELVSRRSGR
jgi:hypothetical protein